MHHLSHLSETQVNRAVFTLPALVRAVVDRWANLSPPQLSVAEDEAVRAVLGYLSDKSGAQEVPDGLDCREGI